MFLGLGCRGGGGVARGIAIRIGSGVRCRRIGLDLSTVVAGFRLGSCAGVSGRFLGFLGEQGGGSQKCNKNERFHMVLNIPGEDQSWSRLLYMKRPPRGLRYTYLDVHKHTGRPGSELRAICAFYCLGLCWSVEFGLSVPFWFFFWLRFLLLFELLLELGSLV